MAFHHTRLGTYGWGLPTDRQGYVPEAGDTIDMFDLGDGFSAEWQARVCDCSLDEAREFIEDKLFPEWVAAAVAATEEALTDLYEWQEANA